MKKTSPSKPDRPARVVVLTTRDLARAIGGADAAVIVENLLVHPRGIQGSG